MNCWYTHEIHENVFFHYPDGITQLRELASTNIILVHFKYRHMIFRSSLMVVF